MNKMKRDQHHLTLKEEGEGESSKERIMAGSSGVLEIFGGQIFSMPFSV